MAPVRPDIDAAVEFLRRWSPEGPWVLTAIHPDRKGQRTATATFRPKDGRKLAAYLRRHVGERNIYFHVNGVTRDLDDKARKSDVASMDWLHVDIDPRAGEDLEQERERALGLLTSNLPEGVPPPTAVVFSGGGYQGFWRLEEPVEIDGDEAAAEEAERYNRRLETLFGGDSTHNVDRIMRLPGTINYPDRRKREKGRVRALARLVEFTDRVYTLAAFSKAPRIAQPDERARGLVAVDMGDVRRVADAEELDQWGVSDYLKVIMAQGCHPDRPKGEGDNSRSGWLFTLCRGLAVAGVPDEVIYGIITDPEWPISESVLELGSKDKIERYALRQITRGKEAAIDPKLEYFNSRYFIVKSYGGRCVVMQEYLDPVVGRPRLKPTLLSSFAQAYENKFIEVAGADGKPALKPAGLWWRQHRHRRQYEAITFAPGLETPEGWYNMWRGFAVEARPGDCSLFLEHVRDNICGGVGRHYDYLVGWMARAVQRPASPGEVAVVLRGGRGVGKSVFARVFGHLFGRHYLQVSNSSHLVGNFNAHLRDLVVLFADEAFYAGDKKHQSILKTLVTEDTIAIEAKGVDVEPAPNFIHLIMASNDEHVVPAGRDERRFFVLDVGDRRQKDTAFFSAMLQQMEAGGYEALLHHLRGVDLDGYDVRGVPSTAALIEQKVLSLRPEEAWWFGRLANGESLREGRGWETQVPAADLRATFFDEARQANSRHDMSHVALGRYLRKVCPGLVNRGRYVVRDVQTPDGYISQKRRVVQCYDLPPLDRCRAAWEELHGPVDWPDNTAQGELPVTGGDKEPPF